jgi:hypothetical protein
MQVSSATKDGAKPGGGGLNWRQRKKINERRQEAMRWRQDLIDGYIAALGGPDRVTAIQRQDAERAADMTALALNMRRRALCGDTTVAITDLTRLEGAADRAVRRLCLPAPNAAAPGDDAWRKFLADQHGDG